MDEAGEDLDTSDPAIEALADANDEINSLRERLQLAEQERERMRDEIGAIRRAAGPEITPTPTDHAGFPLEEYQLDIADAALLALADMTMHQGTRGVGLGAARQLAAGVKRLAEERDKLRDAVAEHHGQRADDRCHLDDDRLYEAADLPPVDRRVGDKAAMLANCRRFIETRCAGGGWRSYAELEADNERLFAEAARLRGLTDGLERIAGGLERKLAGLRERYAVAHEGMVEARMAWAMLKHALAGLLAVVHDAETAIASDGGPFHYLAEGATARAAVLTARTVLDEMAGPELGPAKPMGRKGGGS